MLRDIAEIADYHAHIYFDAATRDVAIRLRAEIAARFTVELGIVRDGPIGPHPVPSYQVAFAPAVLGQILPWLMLNRAGLTVLLHPNTRDPVADHDTLPAWLGTPLPLDLDAVR